MAKYRKKPVFVEAVQWIPTSWHEKHLEEDENGVCYVGEGKGLLKTLNGLENILSGDYIVTTFWGGKTVMVKQQFEQTYEKVAEEKK